MKNLLFKTPAGPRRRAVERLTSGNEAFLAVEDFARVLSLELRRAERSHKVLLFMLLDAGRLLEDPSAAKGIAAMMSAVTTSTRETDVRGWYKKGSIIGVLFTEIGEVENDLVRDAVLRRITKHLENSLDAAQLARIHISLNFLPESWADGNGDAKRYLDLFATERLKADGRALKRMIDVAGATLALIAAAPLFAAIAVLIKLTSRGPVLYRQQRIGKGGRCFECLKFRSMHVSNDAAIHREYVRQFISGSRNGEGGSAVYKLQKDPRITSVGRLLRKTSLDELPQFWNVIKGEMSLVGPRPAIPYELECYDVWHRRRIQEVKPGITGLWQVHGRSKTTFDDMVRLDIRYARTWSLWLDLKILLKTPKAVFSGEGAY